MEAAGDHPPEVSGDTVPTMPGTGGNSGENEAARASPAGTESNERLFDITIENGRYHLFQTVDSGVASKVYLAFDIETQKKYAVKYFDTTNQDYEKYLPSNEIYRTLSHKYIISLNLCSEGQDYIAYVMPNCAGGDLYFKLHEGTKYTIDNAMYIMWEMVQAVFYIHQRGYVHGNICLENILLETESDEKPIAYLSGFSRCNANNIPIDEIPGFEQDFYTAPEVSMTKLLTPSSDVFALGSVFFLLLKSCIPEEDPNSEFETLKKELLKGMLDPDQSHRLTLQDVFKHPFFTRHLNNINKSAFETDVECSVAAINTALADADSYIDDWS